MRYIDFAIEQNKKWLFETAMRNSTPKRLAGHLHEAAEQIAQLQADLKAQVADVQEVREWISVKKDLPRNGLARVLVLLKNEEITDGIGFPRIDTDRYIDGKWARWSSHVTYWMPLPNTAHQIPKGEHE